MSSLKAVPSVGKKRNEIERHQVEDKINPAPFPNGHEEEEES